MTNIVDSEKEFDGQLVESRSVIEEPPRNQFPNTGAGWDMGQLFWFLGQFSEEISAFGTGKIRDAQLRTFITKENIFASALGIICSRNAGFSWKLDGPKRAVSLLQDVFDMANLGKGWHDLIIKTSIDLYTQDSGAFWEIVRMKDSEDSPVIGINHLDAASCYHTGIRETPVIYKDWKGRYHYLKWYQVVTFAEMPVSIERYYGMQYSALTRLLMAMEIQRNQDVYKYEKTSGRNTKEIILAKGITTQQLEDAVSRAKSIADGQGYSRFMNPVLVGTLDPKADVGHDTIELGGLPEKYDEKLNFDHYLNLISMAFESDYQEFAPLPGGGLGTGAQSEMLHLKARGKGPLLFMHMVAHAMNFRIMPKNVKFFWDEQDVEADKAVADVKAIRAQTRAVRIASGELTPQAARQIANDDGDLSLEMITLMNEQDLTTDVTIDNQSSPETQIGHSVPAGHPGPDIPPSAMNSNVVVPQRSTRPAKVPSVHPPQAIHS